MEAFKDRRGCSKRVHKRLIALLCYLLLSAAAHAQEPLEVFGFFQVNYFAIDREDRVSNPFFGLDRIDDNDRLTFNVQQLNLFLRRELSNNLTSWVNFEVTTDFSSDKGWGTFSLEEAWIKYFHRRSLNVKAGLLIPRFNSMNEVKNRMPFLPYVIRPIVYESSIDDLLPINSDLLPQRAYFQVYGLFLKGESQFNYALYLGNAEDEFINNNTELTISTGADTTTSVLIGGRVGFQNNSLTAGLSGSWDKDNQVENGLGEVPRYRMGGDLSLSISEVTLENEVILVRHDLDQPDVSLDKLFYYSTLSYNLTERWLGYGSFTFLKDDFFPGVDTGISGVYFGFAYRPNINILLKAQYARFNISDGTIAATDEIPIPLIFNFRQQTIAAAVSVSF